MAITLEQAKVGMANKVDQAVIDAFQRSSKLLDLLVFDDAVSPGTSGSTLTYGYIQLKTPSTAKVRAINASYTTGEAIREQKVVNLAIMGGSFNLDRVIIGTSGAVNELAFQTEQKVKATASLFHYLAINGVKATDGFDGLNKLLASTTNEKTSAVDISTSAKMDSNYNALLDELDEVVRSVDGQASFIMCNNAMYTKLVSIARRAGYYTRSEDAFGRHIDEYNGIPIIDAGKYYDGASKDVIATTSNKTDIYVARIGLDAFCGITVNGGKMISTYAPDLTNAEEIKKGGVEFVAGVALKNTKAAAVLRGVTITAS